MVENIKPCFLAGTPVHTTTGIKPIEQIQKGDTVLCYDTQLGTLSRKQVIQTYRNHAHKYRIRRWRGVALRVPRYYKDISFIISLDKEP